MATDYNFRILREDNTSETVFNEFKQDLKNITLESTPPNINPFNIPPDNGFRTIESQIRVVNLPNNRGGQTANEESKKKIARLYVVPELYTLYSKLYQSYILRQNFIFSYLYTFEDFYRLSQYYFSHQNPNIRSINKLLRENLKKSENLKMDTLLNLLKDEFEEIKKINTDSISIFRNVESYFNKEEIIESQKEEEKQFIIEKIKSLLQKINPSIFPSTVTSGGSKKKNKIIFSSRSLRGGVTTASAAGPSSASGPSVPPSAPSSSTSGSGSGASGSGSGSGAPGPSSAPATGTSGPAPTSASGPSAPPSAPAPSPSTGPSTPPSTPPTKDHPEFTTNQTLKQIYQKIDLYLNNHTDIDIAKKNIELYDLIIQLQLLLGNEIETKKLSDLIRTNQQQNGGESTNVEKIIQTINEIINDIQQNQNNMDTIYSLIQQYTTLYKIEDEDLKEKKKRELFEKINKLCELKTNLITRLNTFKNAEKIKKNEIIYPFIESLTFILCKELISISFFFEGLNTSSCKEKTNSNKPISIKSIYEKFKNDFSTFIRMIETKTQRSLRFLKLKKREIAKQITTLENEITQKTEENRVLQSKYPRPPQGTNMTSSSRSSGLDRLSNELKKLKKRELQLVSYKNPDGTYNFTISRELDQIKQQIEDKEADIEDERLKQAKLFEEGRDYRENQTKIKKNESQIQMCKAEKDSLTQIQKSLDNRFKEKKEEFQQTIDRIKSLETIHSIMTLLNKVENKTNEIKKKAEELKKKNSNNRMIDAMTNDYLFKFITEKMLSVKVVKNEDGTNKLTRNGKKIYRLTILRSVQSFRKYLPLIKRYFEEKLNYYNNREGILSMLQLNTSLVTGLFEEGAKNLITNAYKFEEVGKSLPNSINNEEKKPSNLTGQTMGYNSQQSSLPYGQTQFGMASEPSYQYPTQQQSYSDNSGYGRGYSDSGMGRGYGNSGFGRGYGMGRGFGNSGSFFGGAAAVQKEEKKPEKKREYEFIKVVDKIFSELRNKVQSNEVYDNRIQTFVEYIDEKDKEITEEILRRLILIEKTKNLQYRFILPEQIRFMVRRLFKIKTFIDQLTTLKKQNKNENRAQLNFIYMTDLILMYFSLQYVFLNLLMCLFKESSPLNN